MINDRVKHMDGSDHSASQSKCGLQDDCMNHFPIHAKLSLE